MEVDENSILYVEINQKAESALNAKEIEREVNSYLMRLGEVTPDCILYETVLPSHINYVRICSFKCDNYKIELPSPKISVRYYVYQVCDDTPQVDSVDEEEEDVPASLNWQLPNAEFEGLWESLILEDGMKDKLISYVQTTLLYSQNRVSAQVVRWNGIVLLHGPPGTGMLDFFS